MITLVRLSNWRAYRDVELQLEPGTTFLIGMNGVGKSSLIEAVRWAFDNAAGPDVEFIRKGERTAWVEVTAVVDGSELRIRRELTTGSGPRPLKTPKVELATWVDGQPVDPEELFDRLVRAWNTEIGFLTRTAFLDMELTGAANDSELRSHLCRAYDLDTIEEHVRAFDLAVKQAEKDAKSEHSASGDAQRKLEEAKENLEREQGLLRATEQHAAEVEERLRAAEEAHASAQSVRNALELRRSWESRWSALATAAAPVIGQHPDGTDLRPLLRSALAAASQQRDEARETNARLRDRIAALEDALATLDGADQECPVCRRPLDERSRAHAHEVQRADRERIDRDLSELDIDTPTTVVAQIQALVSDADRLGDPPPTPATDAPDLREAADAVERVRQEQQTLLGDRGAIGSRIQAAEQFIRETSDRTEAAAEATAAFRRLGALTAARDALKQTVTKVLDDQLEPVGKDVSARWDGIFPDRTGLIVDADGNISRNVAGEPLAYRSFSAGEKTVARLLVRLATLITTTGVPFCWIDEPLEHLDEKSRLVVARTLAMFGKAQVLDQIFVTTYEQSLAELVGQSTDAPHVEYLGTVQVSS